MTFTQTLNPFNKNKETGELKTRDEIMKEVAKERDEWMADTDITCEKCYKK